MFSSLPLKLILSAMLAASFTASASAGPIARFVTNAGEFELHLNPTNDPNLEVHVDNIVEYIDSGSYVNMVINRADPSFVVQMGSFTSDTTDPASVGQAGSSNENGFPSIVPFPPVIVDANNDGVVDFPTLSNTVGTVSLALNSLGPNSGTSSFFINLGNNGFLDGQGFVPFAEVVDLTFFETLDNGPRIDLGPQIGFPPGNLTFGDVPTTTSGELVIVSDVFVLIPEPAGAGLALLGVASVLAGYRRRG